MSWYSDKEPFDEFDHSYCEWRRCSGGDSYEQCQRCIKLLKGEEVEYCGDDD